jgi:hypothetical protein
MSATTTRAINQTTKAVAIAPNDGDSLSVSHIAGM